MRSLLDRGIADNATIPMEPAPATSGTVKDPTRLEEPEVTGLSGNEIYCLALKQYSAGELVVGNSVNSMGSLGSLGAGLTNVLGGDVPQVTQPIHEGRAARTIDGRGVGVSARSFGRCGRDGRTQVLQRQHGVFFSSALASTPSRRPRDCSPALATHRNYFVTWTRAMSRSSMCPAMSLIPSAWVAAYSAR
jgi:hypothetical protein